MKQYTINATSIRPHQTEKERQILFDYMPEVVSSMFIAYGVSDGFTIYPVTGYWQGVKEESYKIEVLTELDFDGMIEVAERLRKHYDQDAVILTSGDIVKFIEREEV